jgi:hypothetical protein
MEVKMKTWIIALVLLAIFVIGGFAVVSAISNNTDNLENTEVNTADITTCSSCGNGCTAQSNCGQATCGAVSGTGSCGCNK